MTPKTLSKTASTDILQEHNLVVSTLGIDKAVVLDADKQMLVLRRSQTHPTLAGQPDLPGGEIEPHEEPGAAVIREILEETGLVIDPSSIELVYAGTDFWHDNYVRMLYIVKLPSSKPPISLSFEHDQFQWRPVDELSEIEKDYIPFYARAFRYIQDNQIL